MKIFIVRHAWAGDQDSNRYPDDRQRPLTREGRERFERVIKKLAGRGFQPALAATSPLVRCRQTADIIVARTECSGPVELEALAPSSDLHELVRWTNAQGSACGSKGPAGGSKGQEPVVWVGHAPDVGRLTAALIGDDAATIGFLKGAVAAIDFPDEVQVGQGILEWLVTAELLKC